jgi:hypothetical protein
MAGHGIAFASDAVCLCEHLSRNPGSDVRLFIKEMQKISHLAHDDAQDTYEKFSAVRREFLQVCSRNIFSVRISD